MENPSESAAPSSSFSLAARVRARVPLSVRQAALRALNLRNDLKREARRQSVISSAELVANAMPLARPLKTPMAVLDYALSQAPKEGLVCEFGVYSGSTLRRISAQRSGAHGFDSFSGLPEDWRVSHLQGAFSVDALPPVGGAELHVGWFDDTLPGFMAEHSGPAAFLHLDADLYSSTVTVFNAFEDRIGPGTVLLFDEYFNYPGWQEHEHKAFLEFIEKTGLSYEYIAYNTRGEQVAVQIR
jgi:hypothetical protein